jgi:Protein of unknown function (DUF4446)
MLRLRRLRRSYTLLQAGDREESFVDVVNRMSTEVERLRDQVHAGNRTADRTRADLRDALRHVAVVRYDAFADMGGRMSFTAALLDDAGDGLLLTSINGRTETRTYAKGVRSGQSEQELSPEERQAIAGALNGHRIPAPSQRS